MSIIGETWLRELMDHLFDLAVKRGETESPPMVYVHTRCPHCGKAIP